MNRYTMITALACGLLLTSGLTTPPGADAADAPTASLEDQGSTDTLLINGRAYPLE